MAWNEVKIKIGEMEFDAFQNTSQINLFTIPCKMEISELTEFILAEPNIRLSRLRTLPKGVKYI